MARTFQLSDFNPWRQYIEDQERAVDALETQLRQEGEKLSNAIERAEIWEREADAHEARQEAGERPEWFPPPNSNN